jgi:hypothetical protein
MPLYLYGPGLLPPWASWETVEVRNPLEGGVWSDAGWSVGFGPSSVPDSSYRTGVGLLENTKYRNRYSGYLRRPLPAGLSMDVSAGREDTLNSQRIRLGWRDLLLTSQFWQGDRDAYAVHCGLHRPAFRVFGGFVHSGPGGRQYELLGELPLLSGPLSIEAAGGAAYVDSIGYAESHALVRWQPGDLSFVGRADCRLVDDRFRYGGAAGTRWVRGPFSLEGGLWSPPGEKEGLMLAVGAGPAVVSAVVRSDRTEMTLAAYHSTEAFTAAVRARGWEDTVGVSALLLPSLAYGNARLYAGGRFETHLDESSEWSTEADILAVFHLGRFDFVGAVEDVQSDYRRRYTYGIVWEFVDQPPFSREEGG